MKRALPFVLLLVLLGTFSIFMVSCGGGGGGGDNCTDADGDGFFAEASCSGDQDCNDSNGLINTSATEICNDVIDNDCDGLIDCNDTVDCSGDAACATCTDADGDGYTAGILCSGAQDCDDDPATGFLINPGAAEICDDLLDNDCDNLVDCYDTSDCSTSDPACVDCIDADTDSYFAITTLCSAGNDCADADSTINPGVDDDSDGYDVCLDCDDDPATGFLINPGASELCDDVDNDCDVATLDGSDETWFGNLCDGIDSDLCNEGNYTCTTGSQECTDPNDEDLDICNGLDDDCDLTSADGSEDPLLGTSCDGGDADLCEEGTITGCTGLGLLVCGDITGDSVEVCNGTDDDCDGQTDEGFPQTVPGGTIQCTSGVPNLQCSSGYINCDANINNGCEVQNSGSSNTTGTPEYLGSSAGDDACGFLCPSSNWLTAATASGNQGRFFTFTVLENSDCAADLNARITLTPPSGTDYDLYVTGGDNCSSGCQSINGGNTTDQITVSALEDFFANNDFTIDIEVRYYTGSSCSDWTLTVQGTNCP